MIRFFLALLATAISVSAAPNIILIYTDDQGFGDASCLNPEARFQTPNLDKLATEGIAFTNAHSADTVCTPSRYALLTGRYCWRTTKKTGVMGAEGACLIKDGRLTIPSMLRDSGYRTAMVGKWHLGMDFPGESHKDRDWTQPVKDMPLDKGFDYFYGIPASLNYGVLAWFEGRHAKVPPTVFTNKKPNRRHVDYRIMPPYEDTPAATKKAIGKLGMEVAPDFIDNQCLTRFTDKAIEWMGANKSELKPFFLYLPYTSPHYPVCPLPEFHVSATSTRAATACHSSSAGRAGSKLRGGSPTPSSARAISWRPSQKSAGRNCRMTAARTARVLRHYSRIRRAATNGHH